MFEKSPDQVPARALCPRCHFPINPHKSYNVDFCMPAYLPSPPSPTPANHAVDQNCDDKGNLVSSPLPVKLVANYPSPLPKPSSSSHVSSSEKTHDVSSSPPSSPTRVASPTHSTCDKDRRSSTASTTSTASTDYSAGFDHLSINTEFEASLRQVEAQYFPQAASQVPASQPGSSPSMESSLVPLVSDEPASLPTGKHWVVFRGHVPGVYMSP